MNPTGDIMKVARTSDDLTNLSDDALFDRLCALSDNQRRAKDAGREYAAAEYSPLIGAVIAEVKRRGGNATEWLIAANTL